MKALDRLQLAASDLTRALGAVVGLARRERPDPAAPDRVVRLRALARETPLILQIETVNACNARCVFCANGTMARKKGVMSSELFAKVVASHARMGGGPVSLTPVSGDALLDPRLLERIDVLDATDAVTQVSLTTNAIALDRYPDAEVLRLLEVLDCIQVSVGGLDAETYASLYQVERFPAVRAAMDRLLDLNEAAARPARITFAFRTNDRRFERRFRRELDAFRRRGAFVSHIWEYANFAGRVDGDERRGLVVLQGGAGPRPQAPCLYGCVSMAICWDGRITACGCTDVEADQLPIGHADVDDLGQVWSGPRRHALFDSFGRGAPPAICRSCSAYLPDADVFSKAYFAGHEAHRPLPIEFFHQYWGG